MTVAWSLEELEQWDTRIRARAEEFGLDCFTQEFEICDHNQMLGYMAYSGMPSHYPHWSYGKAFEKLKTLYDHGVSGLPYEMVINSDPALAYLMRDNSLLLQILTIAHVYGHNDFFKNNFTFRTTNPQYTLSSCKASASRVRRYAEDPSIGLDAVENVLDAAHALALQCRRNLAIRKPTTEEQRDRALAAAEPPPDPFRSIHRRPEYEAPDMRKNPPEPDEDVLLFLRDNNPYMASWERDLLTIAHEQAQYFLPQIETKIMNEGWASFWHKRILDSLELPPDLGIEFLVRHNQVVCPHQGGLNPYHVGIRVWEHLAEKSTKEHGDLSAIFLVRESDRDTSFLRRHLNEELIRELDLFQFAPKADDLVVTEIADEQGWETVRDTLIANVGANTIPVIRVVDGDRDGKRGLLLRHEHDGRDLDPEYAEKTLAFAQRLWQNEVILETTIGGNAAHLVQNDRGFSIRSS